MIYNFNRIVDRKNTSCLKWDYLDMIFNNNEVIPMWVADMDFEAPAPIIEAVKKRAEHGAYGYTARPTSLYDAVMSWMYKRHGWQVNKDWFIFTPGVVPALNMAVLAYTQPGDKVLIQSPVYYPFAAAITNNGRQVVHNNLILDHGKYSMDLESLEKSLDSRTKLMILCNPHNPVGRVWSKEDLNALGEICLRHNIIILSDEIHSDLILNGNKHTPIASISEKLSQITVTCIAPSKTFNVAGLTTSALIIPNPQLRNQFNIVLENLGLGISNIFGITAFEAAYKYGEEWLEQLLAYLGDNVQFLMDFFMTRIPKIKPVTPEGTYLVWLNCSNLNLDDEELKNFMIHKARVGLDSGFMFGPGGQGFQRMNIACSRSVLEEALKRIEKAVNEL